MNTTYQSNNNVVYSCKYHVVWCPKYRRKVLTNGVDVRLKELLTEYAANLSVDILEMEIMPDHVHMLLEGSGVKFPQGVSVYKKDLEKRIRSLSKEDQEQMRDIQGKITAVRFYSELDGKLNALLMKYGAQSDEGEKRALAENAIREWKKLLK